MTEKDKTINKVKNFLIQDGLTDIQAKELLNRSQPLLDEWVHEYLVTGSHLTPIDFADELLQAEEFRKARQNIYA